MLGSLQWLLGQMKEKNKKKKKNINTGVLQCHKFRICPFFVPSTEDNNMTLG